MEGEEQASDDERAFNKKPILTRIAVIAAGPVMNVLIAIILFSIIIMNVGFSTTVIEEVLPDSPAYNAGIRPGDKLIGYEGKKIVHPMDLEIFSYVMKENSAEVVVKRGNEKIQISLVPERFRYILGFTPKESSGPDSNLVAYVDPSLPAGKAGLKENDRIVKINDTIISTRQDINSYLNKNKEKLVKVTVIRDGNEMIFDITPMKERNPEYYAVGIGFESKKGNILESAKNSILYSYSMARSVYYSLFWVVSGAVSPKQMSGPVGIISLIGDVVEQSPTLFDRFFNLFNITAFISMNLGLFNLIPFPALDGSKILLLIIEGVRRKAIPPEKEALISMIGFVLLIMLMIFTTYNDIVRQFGGG